MAESQKAATSSVKPKEKTSELDLDFGKDFLSSWKDDGMDFDFGSTPKSKKKTFDFGKADMDFNLDADFGMLSSFKIDMSDLDVSTPPRKAGKQNERPEEVSPNGSHRKKKDNFSFSFDFNEFDNLNFESTLKKGSEMSNKSKNKEVSSSQSGSGRCSGANLAEDIAPMEDDISSKLPDTQAVNTFKIDTEGDSFKAVQTRSEDGCLKSVTKDSCPPIPANSGEEVAMERARASPEKTMSAVILEKEQGNQQPDKITPPESHRQENFEDLSAQSVADNASTQDTASDLPGEVGIPANMNSSTNGEWNVSEKLIAGPDSTNRSSEDESLPSESMTNSLRKNGDGSKFTGVNDVTITTDGTELTRGNSEFEHLSATNGSNKLLQRAMANGTNQDSTMLHVAPLKSGTTNNDLVSDIDKRTGVIQSIDFKRPNEPESQLQQASLSRTKITFIDSKRISSTQVNPPDERRETDLKATQSGISLAGIRSQPRKLRGDPVQTGNAEGVKGIDSTRECPIDDSIESVSKVMGTSRTQDQDVSKDGLVLIRSEKKIEDNHALSSHLHPSSSNEQANKSTSKSSLNLRLPVSSITSIKNTKNSFLEKIRKSPNQAGRTTTELPSLKSSRRSTAGGKLEAISSSLLKGIKSMRNAEQNMELQETIGSKMAHSAEKKKQTPPMLTLKRKAFEDSNGDKPTFTPFKRLSPSPRESRNAREPSDRLVNKQVCNHENMANDNTRNTLQDCQKPTLDKPPEVSLTELETSLSIESDNNVEKAEACSKELEYICNMLKKKHDEAKEILVRAIVNNNNLLMLNHPMHQEKIRMVQKFASLLILK